MPTPELRIPLPLLRGVVQITPNIKFHAHSEGYLVSSYTPEEFGFFTAVKAVDINELYIQ